MFRVVRGEDIVDITLWRHTKEIKLTGVCVRSDLYTPPTPPRMC